MSADPSPSVREELPLHAAWVRRLAGRLVRDERAAEDLAQETVLAALRARRPIRGALQPWLARVAANLARRGWRDAETRKSGERNAARAEALPAPEETLGRLELQEQLVEELKRLDEPARTVLVRRFFDGWSAARIAHEAGLPASTVRWHLQRGLAEMRARLDRRAARDGLQWRPALLALARWRPPFALSTSTLSGSLHGAMAMKVSAQLVVVGVFVLATGLGVFLAADKESSAPRGAPAPVELANAEAPSAPLAPRAGEVELAGARVAVPVAAPERVQPPPAPAAEARPLVDGRCVDQALVPIGGALVTRVDEGDGGSARSAGDGTFALACAGRAEGSATVRVEAEGFGTRFVDALLAKGDATHLGDVVLAPGGSVRGRVLTASGAPFADAEVHVTDTLLWEALDEARQRGPNLYAPTLSAVSARDGTFVVPGVPAGMVRVWASAPGMLHAVTAPVEVPVHGESEELVLTLEPNERPETLAVVVLDPEGEPVPRARLRYTCHMSSGGSTSSSKETDDGGRVELPAPPGSSFDLSASDGAQRWVPVAARAVEASADERELRFVDSPWIEVAVRAGGEAVSDYSLAACALDAEPALGRRGEHDQGRARLHAPTEAFVVVCDAPGYRVAQRGPFTPEATPATLEFELEREPGLRGRVTSHGAPLAGARVTLHDADPKKHIDHDGYPSFVLPAALDETHSDAEGRFVLRARERGEFVVRAEAEGQAAADVGPFAYEPAQGRTDLELALTSGGAIEGRVFMPAGREAAGVIVAVNRGDAHARTVRSGADGSFRFEGLTPGHWRVARGQLEVGDGSGTAYEQSGRVEIDFNCTVVDGETTTCNVDLRDWQPCVLDGLLTVNGAAAAGWDLEVWPAGRSAIVGDLPTTSTDSAGHFRLDFEEAARVRLVFSPPRESARGGTLAFELELHPGDNPWKMDLALGTLTGTLGAARGAGAFYYASAPGQEPVCMLPLTPDADGRFTLPFVPAGRGTLEHAQGTGAARTSTTMLEVDVPARGTREVRVP